jgi:hypothetical protein
VVEHYIAQSEDPWVAAEIIAVLCDPDFPTFAGKRKWLHATKTALGGALIKIYPDVRKLYYALPYATDAPPSTAALAPAAPRTPDGNNTPAFMLEPDDEDDEVDEDNFEGSDQGEDAPVRDADGNTYEQWLGIEENLRTNVFNVPDDDAAIDEYNNNLQRKARQKAASSAAMKDPKGYLAWRNTPSSIRDTKDFGVPDEKDDQDCDPPDPSDRIDRSRC